MDQISLSGSAHSSSGIGAHPPLIFQERGAEALNSPMKDDNFPSPADDTITQTLWPLAEWNKVLHDDTTKSEAKLDALIANQTEETLAVANSVFVKPKQELCHPKTADFVLVDKKFKDVPTAENVGAILYAQSTSEASKSGKSLKSAKSYSTSYAVGEAVHRSGDISSLLG